MTGFEDDVGSGRAEQLGIAAVWAVSAPAPAISCCRSPCSRAKLVWSTGIALMTYLARSRDRASRRSRSSALPKVVATTMPTAAALRE